MAAVDQNLYDVRNIISSLDNPAAGTTYSVQGLCEATAAAGVSTNLLTLAYSETKMLLSTTPNLRIVKFPATTRMGTVGRRLGYSRAMFDYCRYNRVKLLHLHGLWMLPNIIPGLIAIKSNTPYMISPHGMLGEEALRFSSRKKRIMLTLGQQKVLSNATCIRATAPSEVEAIRAFGLNQPIALLPNGVDIPFDYPFPIDGHSSQKYLLFLGRVHPIKGLKNLINAWATQADRFPNWSLRIVGPDEGNHKNELNKLVTDISAQRVTIEDAVFGENKVRIMSEAGVFVLPSLVENFAMAVAESLGFGVPVISSKGAPWAGLEEHHCGWWVDADVETLSATLARAMSLSHDERTAMGMRGRNWIMRDFAWQGIGQRTRAVYDWMVGNGGPTQDLIFD
jgi:glycosyltransferase involved in cell wall biosynthesis